MIKRKKIIKVRRNPRDLRTDDIASVTLWTIPYKFLGEGGNAAVYKFKLKSSKVLHPLKYFDSDSNIKVKLSPGEYVLKIETRGTYDSLEIKYFKELSDLKLIPKIHFIDDKIVIMDYAGKSYAEMGHKLSESKIKQIKDRLEKLLKKWHRLGYSHGDINEGNIVIDETGVPSLIDPADPLSEFIETDLYELGLVFE